MNTFKNIRIKTLIVLALSILTALLLAIGSMGIYSINNIAEQLRNISLEDVKTVATVETIRYKMEINRSQILQKLRHNPVMDWSKLHEHATSIHSKIISDTSHEINKT